MEFGLGLGTLPITMGSEIALAVFVFPLVLAGVSDFKTLRIPNWLTGALALAFPIVALAFGHHVDWLSHIGAGVLVFVGAAILFALRWMGGGDVKLLAATALWTGLDQLFPFLVLTALVGGVFAIIVVVLRHPVVQTSFLATIRRLPAFTQKQMPLPYGIPIAIAGILMAPGVAGRLITGLLT